MRADKVEGGVNICPPPLLLGSLSNSTANLVAFQILLQKLKPKVLIFYQKNVCHYKANNLLWKEMLGSSLSLKPKIGFYKEVADEGAYPF